MLKLGWSELLYHHIAANDHVISNDWCTFIFINLKAVQYYLSDRTIWHEKWHLDVMHRTIYPCGYTILYLIGTYLTLVRFSVLPFNHDVGSSDIPQLCKAGNYSSPMSLIYWRLIIFLKKYCIDKMAVHPNPWPPVWYISLANL